MTGSITRARTRGFDREDATVRHTETTNEEETMQASTRRSTLPAVLLITAVLGLAGCSDSDGPAE